MSSRTEKILAMCNKKVIVEKNNDWKFQDIIENAEFIVLGDDENVDLQYTCENVSFVINEDRDINREEYRHEIIEKGSQNVNEVHNDDEGQDENVDENPIEVEYEHPWGQDVSEENNQTEIENEDTSEVEIEEESRIETEEIQEKESLTETEEIQDKDTDTSVSSRGTKRKLNKKLRMEGKQYLGFRRPKNQKLTYQDIERHPRIMGAACTSKTCKKSQKRMCNNITELDRKKIFHSFWTNLTSWGQKKVYVANLVIKRETQRRTSEAENSRRSSSLFYHLNIGENRIPVCKNMFLKTLGLKEWTVKNWVDKSAYGISVPSQTSTRLPRSKNKENVKFLSTFLESLPKLPSHYCRKETKKMYLEQTFTSFADLYKIYQEHCKNSGQVALSRNTLMKYVNKMNIGIFSPRKDQCDLCVQFEAGNLEQDTWEKHRRNKERAQQEKNNDKQMAHLSECYVICIDLQAVKTCPSLQASSLYFKSKLCCHNFTAFDLKTKDATCYWFDETNCDLQASTFASLLIDFLVRKYLQDLSNIKPIVIFSDGCTYQNRNAVLANALLHLSYQYKIVIIQKFLVKGHTNMECDSVHATIENKLKNKTISVPNDYHRITIESRINPKP